MTDMRQKAAEHYDGVISTLRNEPSAFKRQCFRDGWDAAIEAMPQWQPIETAPKDGTKIIAWCDHSRSIEGDHLTVYAGHCKAFGCNESEGINIVRWGGEWITVNVCLPDWWFDDEDFESPVNPTHWMPLPAPPSVGIRGDGV